MLFDLAYGWFSGKSFGMVQLVGPLAFSDKDPQGFLIEGYDKPVVIASNCNFPYMVDLTEAAGFTKKVDCVVYQIPIPDQIPPLHQKILERAEKQNTNLRLLEFTSRRKIKPLIHQALQLVNDTFGDIYGFVPFNAKEMDDFANKYLFIDRGGSVRPCRCRRKSGERNTTGKQAAPTIHNPA